MDSHEVRKEAEERQAPPSRVLHDAILASGWEELSRPSSALAWSGLAAGLSMGFSMLTEAMLAMHLPEAEWTPLVTKLGYSVGFLIVILGRQQLFTENTLTSVLPLLEARDLGTFLNMLRLWGVVLLANLVGALLFAFAVTRLGAFKPEAIEAFLRLGDHAMEKTFLHNLTGGVFAGWLIALIVWILPNTEQGRVPIIIILTYLIGIGSLSHVVVGSITVFTHAAEGRSGWLEALGGYSLPALIGNVIGGVTLVTLVNHRQVFSGREQLSSAERAERA